MRKSDLLFIICLGVSAVFVILYATSTYGTGISPDSVGYITVARNLADGNGFTDRQGNAFVIQPPLFPIALASIELLSGIDPVEGARYLNALLAGCIVSLGSFALLRFTRRSLALLGGFAIFFSTPLVYVSTYAWSEPLFNFLVLIFLVIVTSRSKLEHRQAIILGLVTALACLTRYIGYSLVVTGLIFILSQKEQGRTKLVNAFLFGVSFLIPIGIWLIRNWIVSRTLFGPRAPSSFTLFDNLYYTYSTVFAWFLPERALQFDRVIFVVIIVGVLVSAIYASCCKGPARTALIRDMVQPTQIGLFVAVYLAFLIVSSTTTAYDRIGTRLLSPISVPVIIVLVLVFDIFLIQIDASGLSKRLARKTRPFASVLFALFLIAVPARNALVSVKGKVEQGAGGYNTRSWRQSETIQYLQTSLFPDVTIYSNRPDALFFLTGLQAKSMPHKTFYNSKKLADDLSALEGKWPEQPGSYLIVFEEGRSYLFAIDELRTIADISLVSELSDGEIYIASPKQH